MVIQSGPSVSDGTVTGKSDLGRYRRLARVSLFFGILSIPLAFLFIPGAIAVMYGHKARKGLLVRSRRGWDSNIALIGMGLGLMSFLLGILMMFSAPIASLDRALGIATRSAGIAMQSGVENFYSEFGRMPVDDDRVTTDSDRGVNLLGILLGMEKQTPEARNPRGIRFLAVKEALNRKNGVVYGETGIPEGMFDAYGNAYTVFLMGEDEGSLRFQFAGKTIELEGRRAAVVSPGKDGKLETEDDLKSW